MPESAELMKSEAIRRELQELIINFEVELRSGNLREKVLALIPCFNQIRELGKSLIPNETARSARARILHYFQEYPFMILNGKEFLVISGIQEYARRIRELRVQYGWSIVNGDTAKQMEAEGEFPIKDLDASSMGPVDYILVNTVQDRDAAHRWNVANEIRRESLSVRDKCLSFLRSNVGRKVTGEELRYVANGRTEWARRVRELRTELGWPVVTKNSGRPDFDIGVYMLEADRQSPEHDRTIPDRVRREVLRRDGYRCSECEWTHNLWNRDDPRHLELHHKEYHSRGGSNETENLVTLCTVCHDELHSSD